MGRVMWSITNYDCFELIIMWHFKEIFNWNSVHMCNHSLTCHLCWCLRSYILYNSVLKIIIGVILKKEWSNREPFSMGFTTAGAWVQYRLINYRIVQKFDGESFDESSMPKNLTSKTLMDWFLVAFA